MYPKILASILLLFVFLSLRLWRIEETLFFFGDIGRDTFVLQTWLETGKPPLLGPQTSALPFNQSAWYFYLLLPLYVLTGESLLSTIYSGVLIHVLVFAVLLWWVQKRAADLWWPVWWSGLLLAIHPEMVLQHRLLWNPSFVAISLLVGVVVSSVWLRSTRSKPQVINSTVQNRWQRVLYYVFGREAAMVMVGSLALAAAIGWSYSAVPAVLLWLCVLSWRQPGWWRWWLGFGIGLALVFAPMIFFELRHSFPLTKMMLFQPKLAQQGTEFTTKLRALINLVGAGIAPLRSLVVLLLSVVMAGLVWWQTRGVGKVLFTNKAQSDFSHTEQQRLVVWFVLVLASYLLLPVGVQAHYVFPLVTALVCVLVWTTVSIRWLVILGIALIWLQPVRLAQYQTLPPRTIAESVSCAELVCQSVTEPLFVSVQAGLYPYHNGIEFQYLLHQAGCQVKKLDTQIDEAQVMAVFVEQSVYEHGKTAYNELTQFGPSELERELVCNPKLAVKILRKN